MGSVGLGSVFLAANAYGWIAAVATGVSILALAVGAGLKFESLETIEVNSIDQLTAKGAESQVGRFDLSSETLEFEIRSALESLANQANGSLEVLFVVDELDKLEISHDSQDDRSGVPTHDSPDPVFTILTSLKNFFTAGNAVYVFITDQSFWERVAISKRTASYAPSHTIFTDRVFVGQLHYKAVENLISRSVSLGQDGASEEFERFKNYVCWQSNQHVFDVIQILASFVQDSLSGPRLVAVESGMVDGRWQEGNLPEDWLTRAALQKHIGVAYDESYRTGYAEELYNQALWSNLHDVCQLLIDQEEIAVPAVAYVALPSKISEALSEQEEQAIAQSVERLLVRLERRGAVRTHTTTVEATDDVEPYDIVNYSLVEDVPYPDKSIAEDSVLLPTELALVEVAETLESIVTNGSDFIELDADSSDTLKRIRTLRQNVEKVGNRKFVPRSTILRTIPLAESLAEQLIDRAVVGAVSDWSRRRDATVASGLAKPHPKTRQPWSTALGQDFKPLVEAVGAGTDVLVIGEPSRENGVIVLPLPAETRSGEVLDGYTSCLAESEKDLERRAMNLPLVQIAFDDEHSPELPVEVVELLDEVEETGFLSRIFPIGQKRKTEKRQVSGYSLFLLAPDLANIADLATELSRIAHLAEPSE